MNRLRRTPEVDAPWLGCWTDGANVRSVVAPEPPLCASLRAGRGSVRELSRGAKPGGDMEAMSTGSVGGIESGLWQL